MSGRHMRYLVEDRINGGWVWYLFWTIYWREERIYCYGHAIGEERPAELPSAAVAGTPLSHRLLRPEVA